MGSYEDSTGHPRGRRGHIMAVSAVGSFTGRKRVRKNFGRIAEVAPMPNLIEVQKSSYDAFLQMGVAPEKRADVGLQEVFKSVFPIRDRSEEHTSELQSLLRISYAVFCLKTKKSKTRHKN